MRRIIFGNDSTLHELNLINTKYAVGILDNVACLALDILTFASDGAFHRAH